MKRPLVMEQSPSQRYPPTPWSAQRLYRPFVTASFVFALTLGFTTGAAMLLLAAFNYERGLWWLTHAQSHGMAQLFGFAGLFTMGVAFHVVPRLRNGSMRFPWPQRACLWLSIAGVTLRFVGQSFESYPITGVLLGASGALLLVGYIAFALTILETVRRGKAGVGAVDKWIYAGIGWAVAAACLHMAIIIWLIDHEATIAPHYLGSATINAALFGFIGSFIMGISGRAVAGFLGLRPMRKRLEIAGFAALQGGLMLAVVSQALELDFDLTALGLLIVSAGAIIFVGSLRILEPSTERRPPVSPGAYPRYGWFIRCAYAWLVVGATLQAIDSAETLFEVDILPTAYTAPILHVLTVGFVTSMIIGMGARMVPLFEGAIMPRHRLLDTAFALLTVSVALRTMFGFTVEEFTDSALGLSGTAGMLAMIFAWLAIRGGMKKSSRAKYQELAAEVGRVRWGETQAAGAARGTGD